MDFLRRHVEKLVLGFALLGLLASCYYLLHCLKGARENVREVQDASDVAVVEGKPIDPAEKKGSVPREIVSPKLPLKIIAAKGKCSLGEPAPYVRCNNPDCAYLAPYEEDQCPFCSTEQLPKEVEEKEVSDDEDVDGDGMPDVFELQHSFLNPRDSSDKRFDYDRDGFTNLEEYKAQPRTKLDDAKSYPPLVHNLRYVGLKQDLLPIQLSKISRNNQTDPKRWDISCYIMHRGRRVQRIFRLGDTTSGYLLVSAEYKVEERKDPRAGEDAPPREFEVSELTVKRETSGEEYVLIVGKAARDKEVKVNLMFLSNRYDPRRCGPKYSKKAGEKFKLPHRPSRKIQEYELVEVTPVQGSSSKANVVVKRIDGDDDPGPFTVKRLSRGDFLPREMRLSTGGDDDTGAMEDGMSPDDMMRRF